MQRIKNRLSRAQALTVGLGLIVVQLMVAQSAYATNLTNSSVILTNMAAGGASAVIFEFTTSSGNTGTTMTIQFPQYTGTTNGIVATSQTYSQTYNTVNCTNSAITGASHNLPGSPTAAGSGTTITLSSMTALTGSTSYCGVLTGTSVTNPSSGTAADTAIITAGTDAAQTVQLDILSADTVSVTATVPQTFTLTVGGSSDPLGTLSTGSVAGTAGVLFTVNTNAKYGWFLYGSDSSTGLNSPTTSHTITAAAATANSSLAAGTEGYLSGATITQQGSGGGTTSLTNPYSSSGSGNGAGLNTSENLIAKSTGTAVNAQVTVKEYAAISGITPYASDYADTLTFVGAGSF
ncbi:MAG TPA: hypothetical protein VGS08_02815 [Candidatus Saccharimonadales bacterium]|nr:hypothetical protein [Candidatus Saccharimonadales bacterium]